MNKPILVIMAAGMGSRYGGLKQIDPVDEQRHLIIDYSIYDAKCAGFEKVVFIIKEENRKVFEEVIGNRISQSMEVEYAYQNLRDLPEGYEIPEGRVKPWGTAHAVMSVRNLIEDPFAVINADDYYGKEAFKLIYQYLLNYKDDNKYRYAMVGYKLKNTVTENGTVARGVCEVNTQGELVSVTERTKIAKKATGIAFSEDDGDSWINISQDSTVSMNMWGFSKSILKEIESKFATFLNKGLMESPLKCEYYLPTVVSELLSEQKAAVQVLSTKEKWYGVTYKEDKQMVVNALSEMRAQGLYPEEF